jgi:hypothetical protein
MQSGPNVSGQTWDPNDLWYELRYNYGAGSGTGSVAINESHRVIRRWTPEIDYMAKAIWEMIEADDNYKHLADGFKGFNHVAELPYGKHNNVGKHNDCAHDKNGKFCHKQNSQAENSPVAILTIGDTRPLEFYRRFVRGGIWVDEKEPCARFDMSHFSVLIVDPDDEKPKKRNNKDGKIQNKLNFVHGVPPPKSKERNADFLSCAFVFRIVTAIAPVSIHTNTVMVGSHTIKN